MYLLRDARDMIAADQGCASADGPAYCRDADNAPSNVMRQAHLAGTEQRTYTCGDHYRHNHGHLKPLLQQAVLQLLF